MAWPLARVGSALRIAVLLPLLLLAMLWALLASLLRPQPHARSAQPSELGESDPQPPAVLAQAAPLRDAELGAMYNSLPETAPLKPSQLAALAQQLQAAGLDPYGAGSPTWLHGFLYALAVGPGPIAAEEWLAHLLADRRPLQQADLAALLGSVRSLRERIEADLLRPGYKLSIPGLHPGAPGMKPIERSAYLHQWSAGFMQAASLRAGAWQELLGDRHAPLHLIWQLGTAEGDEWNRQAVEQAYLHDGYDGDEAEAMTLRFYGLPSIYRNTLAGLHQRVAAIGDHWSARSAP